MKRQLAEVEATAEAAAAAAQKRLKEYVSKARVAEAECEALRTRPRWRRSVETLR